MIPKSEKDARWQDYFDDYCFNEFGGREPSGREHDEAAAYADEMEEEEENAAKREARAV